MGGSLFTITFPTNTLRALLPPRPFSYTVCFVPCAFLFTARQSIPFHILFIIFIFTPRKRAPCFSHLLELHVYLLFPIHLLPFPTIPSTALRSEYPFKFQKWNFLQYSLVFVRVHPLCSFVRSFVSIRLLICLYIRSFFRLFVCLFVYPLSSLFACSLSLLPLVPRTSTSTRQNFLRITGAFFRIS